MLRSVENKSITITGLSEQLSVIFRKLAHHSSDLDEVYTANPRCLTNINMKADYLAKLARQIRHDEPYLEFVKKTHDLMLNLLIEDEAFILSLCSPHADKLGMQRATVRKFLEIHTHAASRISGYAFKTPHSNFFEKKADVIKTVKPDGTCHTEQYTLQALFLGNNNFMDPALALQIQINIHEDAKQQDTVSKLVSAYHESIHAQGYSLGHGVIHRPDDVPLDLHDAGRLWAALELYDVFIPCRYQEAYKAMFHEAIAWEMHRKFSDDLRQKIIPLASAYSRLTAAPRLQAV